ALSTITSSFFFPRSAPHRHLHSFPTRRSSDLPIEHRVAVLEIERQPDRRAADGLRAARVHLRMFISEHNVRIADLDFRVADFPRSEEHTSELQSRFDLVCRLLLEKKKNEL